MKLTRTRVFPTLHNVVSSDDHEVVSPFVFMDVACRLILELVGGGMIREWDEGGRGSVLRIWRALRSFAWCDVSRPFFCFYVVDFPFLRLLDFFVIYSLLCFFFVLSVSFSFPLPGAPPPNYQAISSSLPSSPSIQKPTNRSSIISRRCVLPPYSIPSM